MKKTKQFLLMAMIVALVLSAATIYAGGVEEGEETSGTSADKTIIIGMDQEPETLDASTNGLHLVRWCTDAIFGRLIWLDESGSRFIPAIAESWTFVTDKKIEFKLRKDVVFHNGRTLVADDIVYCLNVQGDKDYGGNLYNGFAPYVESVEATDDYTVVINMKSPYPAILSIIVQIPIFAPETIDTIATAPVGTGPFKFVSWDKNQTLKLEAFDDYYEPGVPAYKYLTYNFYAEYNTCLTAYMSGEVDIINWMSAIDVPTIEGLGDSYTQTGLAGIYYFQGRMTEAPFNKPGVMKALALGVNRGEMNELVLDNKGLRVWLPLTPEDFYYPKDIEYEQNITLAKKLLADAGYPDGFTVSLLAPLTAVEGVLAEVMQAQLAEIGVTIELDVLEVPAFLDKWRGGDFDLAICGHGFEIDPSILLNRWMSTDTRNYGHYSNPEFDKLCAEAVITVDPEKRKELYYKAYHLFVEDAGINYLIGENRYSAVRNNVTGLIKRGPFNDYTRLMIE
jgi:peptide/nickel transport system substrate-binding protein